MRGLAFPPDAVFDRDNSNDFGTPVPPPSEIPIDPALAGPAIDPALTGGHSNVAFSNDIQQPNFQHSQFTASPQHHQIQQYSDGPQGDPFAPQLPPIYFPIEVTELVPPVKPTRRKRRPPRERECGFCQGNDKKNKDGQPEIMATCDECGRSGHPSCMQLPGLGPILQSYPWKCTECKTCEICKEKGDDARILFCDFCDRGWHMDCLEPPLQDAPNGRWHCPECPPVPLGQADLLPADATDQPLDPLAVQELSDASSPHSTTSKPHAKGKGKTKGKVKIHISDDSEDVDIEADAEVRSKGRGRPKKVKRSEPQYTDEERAPPFTPRQTKRTRVQPSPVAHPLPRIRLRLPTQKGRWKELEEDEPQKGLFDDILTGEERNTLKTSITSTDKQRFERSRIVAEEQLAPPPPPRGSNLSEMPSTPGPSSRPLRSNAFHPNFPHASTSLDPSASPAPSSATPAPFKGDPTTLRIRSIRFGQFDIKTWFDAPFPEEYSSIPDGKLWICEFCLKYMKSRFACERHGLKCKARHPPGDEIYRDGAVSVFEVDGRKNKIYCQNLCLLSKMFLDHKSLFYDVEPFLFYVMTELDDCGARFVGYFSKEKSSPKDYNVSCIMTLPVRQRQGWGNLLIDFSYLLSKKERRVGSPEKPLSDLGALGYKNYWTLSLMRYLDNAPDNPRLEDISSATSMTLEDIVTTLKQQSMITAREVTPPPIKPLPGQTIKLHKGRRNGVNRRQPQRTQTNDRRSETPKGPFVPPKHYEIAWDREKVTEYLRAWDAKGYLTLKPEKLQWSPYILTRKERSDKLREVAGNLLGINEETSIAPEVTSPTKSGFTSANGDTQPATPNIVPTPSPVNIFDDDQMVEEVPRTPSAKRKSRSKSPPVTNGLPDVSLKKQVARKRDPPELTISQGRLTRSGRHLPHELSKERATLSKLPSTPRRQGRPSKTGADQENKGLPASAMTSYKTRKRMRNGSIDVGFQKETSDTTEDLSPPAFKIPNGQHTNELAPIDQERIPFENEVIPMGYPTVTSVVVVQKHINVVEDGEQGVKAEDICTPFTNPLPSDVTVYMAGVPNGKDVSETVMDESDADADGEYEEDAEGEVDEEAL